MLPRALLELASQAGWAGVEWLDRLLPSWRGDNLQELGREANRLGLSSGALSICLESQAPLAQRRTMQRQAVELLQAAPYLGITVVRVAIGGGGALSLERTLLLSQALRVIRHDTKIHLGLLSRWIYLLMLALPAKPRLVAPPLADRNQLDQAAELMYPVALACQRLGLRLGLENHFGLTSHAQDIIYLIDQCGLGMGVCLDLGNFFADQDALAQVKALAPRTVHVHFKTTNPQPSEEAMRLAYDQRLNYLMASDYQGMFSMEYLGPGSGWEGAQAGARVLQKLYADLS